MIGGIAMASVFGAMTEERKARIWHLWQQGRPMSEVARHIVKPPATVYSYLLYHGGIKPRVRTRREHCLSVEERESISRGLAKGESMRSIASQLGRAP
jgi:IS30 family transposase